MIRVLICSVLYCLLIACSSRRMYPSDMTEEKRELPYVMICENRNSSSVTILYEKVEATKVENGYWNITIRCGDGYIEQRKLMRIY